jgi:hypothetical protein
LLLQHKKPVFRLDRYLVHSPEVKKQHKGEQQIYRQRDKKNFTQRTLPDNIGTEKVKAYIQD